MPGKQDPLNGVKVLRFNDWLVRCLASDPHIWWVPDAHSLQLEGDAVVHVVADVFLVGEHLVDEPRVQVGRDRRYARAVEARWLSPSRSASVYEMIDTSANDIDAPPADPVLVRLGRSGCSFARRGPARPCVVPTDPPAPAQPVASHAALTKAEFDQPTLTREHLGG